MPDEIREIVKTYNLPSRINSLVLRIVDRNIQRLGLTSFSDQYRYISDLVDKFQASREDRNAVSLDSPISNDGRTWHDVLSYGSNPYEDEEGLTLDRAVDISDKFLVERHKEITRRLLRDSNPQSIIDLTSDEIFADFFGISLRSEAVTRYLERGGRIYPERRMIYVNLDTENPWIQWGKRNYHGDPLSYFRRHQEVYGRFLDEGRSALQKFDKGLYLALSKRKSKVENGSEVKQLEIAIAMSRKPVEGRIGVNSLAYLKQNLENFRGLSREEFRTNYAVLYNALVNTKQLREAYLYLEQPSQTNKKINKPKGTRYNPKEIEKILEAHILFKGNAMVASRGLGYPSASIKFIWEKYNLKAIGKRSGALTNDDIQKILEAHRIYFGNCRLAARKLKLTHDTVRRHWMNNGLKATGNGVNYIQQKVA